MPPAASCFPEARINPPNYSFAHHRLNSLSDSSRTPVVLVACGSFNPLTYLHLRMFEMAKDYARQNTNFEVVGGYLSPVSDEYKKPGLISAFHRVNMCSLAAEEASPWLMVDSWESSFQTYQRTAVVLVHIDHQINTVLGGVRVSMTGERRPVKVMLLAGLDLISSMSEPGVWATKDLECILKTYGTFAVERESSSLDQEFLEQYRQNIYVVNQLIQNDVSSTKVRLFLRRGLSIRYLLPAAVVEYIEENRLYVDDVADRDKEKGEQAATGS